MLELLKLWAELEPELLSVSQQGPDEEDVHIYYHSYYHSSLTWLDLHYKKHIYHAPNRRNIEYAVRDAIEARGLEWVVKKTRFEEDYLGIIDNKGSHLGMGAPSPAEALLKAYVEYLKK